jgi:AraC-like DNA-binding protein
VIPAGLPGLALAGISPSLGITDPVILLREAREAFALLLPDGGEALQAEIAALVAAERGVAPLVLALRRELAAAHGSLDLAAAARRLGLSPRSLQRALAQEGASFRTEQADARFRAAEELLRGDDQLAAVAARVGLSEDGLALLVRARTGLTPAELRRRLRAGA